MDGFEVVVVVVDEEVEDFCCFFFFEEGMFVRQVDLESRDQKSTSTGSCRYAVPSHLMSSSFIMVDQTRPNQTKQTE